MAYFIIMQCVLSNCTLSPLNTQLKAMQFHLNSVVLCALCKKKHSPKSMRINHPFTTLDNQKQKLHNDAMSLKAALLVTALNGRRADNNRQLISKAGRKHFATSPCVTTSTVSHFYLSNSMSYFKICPTETVLDMAESPNPGAVCPDRAHSEQHGKANATASQQMALIYYNIHTYTHTQKKHRQNLD